MPWIHQIPIAEATGLLKEELDAALARAGRVWHIVHVMSLNPPVLKASIAHYAAVMFGTSPLGRAQREMLATVVSSEVGCHY
jgi:alkylhydroperoxidase family enzyme